MYGGALFNGVGRSMENYRSYSGLRALAGISEAVIGLRIALRSLEGIDGATGRCAVGTLAGDDIRLEWRTDVADSLGQVETVLITASSLAESWVVDIARQRPDVGGSGEATALPPPAESELRRVLAVIESNAAVIAGPGAVSHHEAVALRAFAETADCFRQFEQSLARVSNVVKTETMFYFRDLEPNPAFIGWREPARLTAEWYAEAEFERTNYLSFGLDVAWRSDKWEIEASVSENSEHDRGSILDLPTRAAPDLVGLVAELMAQRAALLASRDTAIASFLRLDDV